MVLDTRSGIATHPRARQSTKTVTYPKTAGIKIKTVKKKAGGQFHHYKGLGRASSRKPADCYGQTTKNNADDLSLFGSCGSSLEESTDEDEACPPPPKIANTSAPGSPTGKSITTSTTSQEPEPATSSPHTQDAQTQTDGSGVPAAAPTRTTARSTKTKVMKFTLIIRDGEVRYGDGTEDNVEEWTVRKWQRND